MTEPIEKYAEAMTYGGSGSAVIVWGLSLGDIAAVAGIAIAFTGFCIQLWAARRRDRREMELHEAQLKALQDKNETGL